MLTKMVKKLSPKERFLYWVKERREILAKRVRGESKPWTDDWILKSCYFTNVMREDDKVTKWFCDNIRGPLAERPEVVFATIAFRWFNWPDTGLVLAGGESSLFMNWDCNEAVNRLEEVKCQKKKIFTGAFTISNTGSIKPKINRVCEDYIQPVWECKEKLYNSIRGKSFANAFKRLEPLPGLGGSGFMAAQVLCDLAYTHVLREAEDWRTWCSWGPGSRRGMNRAFSLPEDNAMPRKEWHKNLETLQDLIENKLGLELHARDVQNCLCEFSKYERVLWDEGRAKRRYDGE